MRSLFVPSLLGVLTLASCAPSILPEGPPVTEPRLEADAILAADGARLPLRVWLPEGKPSAVVLALHGFNDYSNAFAKPGAYLAGKGIAVYAYDQRGFGRAPNPGGWAGRAAMVDDLDTAAALIEAKYPGLPFYLLGESMGGAVAMAAMAERPPAHVAGVILAAPAVWSRSSMNIFERGLLWASAHTVPWLPVSGRGLDIRPSDNEPMLRELSRDPLVIKETRVGTLDGLVDLMDDAYAVAPKLKGPILLLYGEHDEIVPPAPSYRVMAAIRSDRLTRAVYAKGWHMLLRDLEARTVLDDIASWITDPAAPLPSGADRHAAQMLTARPPTLVPARDPA